MTATTHQSKDVLVITRGEKVLHTANLTDMLFGDTITGTPTVSDVDVVGLLFGTVTVNSGTLSVEGISIAVGKACQFTIDARSVALADIGECTVRVTFSMTSGGGPRTFDIRVEIVA